MILREGEIMRCPKCGGDKFYATAHVTQDWILDGHGNFEKCVAECVETLYEPDGDDIWMCCDCGYDADGNSFVVTKPSK